MDIFNWNGIDAVYWFDVDQYHKEHPDKKQVYVWHGDSMALLTFNAINVEVSIGNRLGAYLANGNFVFHDDEGTSHYVFKDSNGWQIWREMERKLYGEKKEDGQKDVV